AIFRNFSWHRAAKQPNRNRSWWFWNQKRLCSVGEHHKKEFLDSAPGNPAWFSVLQEWPPNEAGISWYLIITGREIQLAFKSFQLFKGLFHIDMGVEE